MKLVIFSDIHGNSYAFNAFLEHIKNISYDYLVFCGDIFGYYYNQKEIIEGLRQLSDRGQLIWLRGNHDEYFLKLYGLYNNNEIYSQNRRDEIFCIERRYIEHYGHSYENVGKRYTPKEAELIESHESWYILEAEGCRIGIFHGTPQNSLEGRLYPNNEILNPQDYHKYDIVILGHTHCRMLRYEGDTLIVNSGSLGQPRDGNGFGFAILDTVSRNAEFCNVEIDRKLLYRDIDSFDADLTKLKEVLERTAK